MVTHYMTRGSGGKVSGCGKRSYQIALSTEFTFIPDNVGGKCKPCQAAAKYDIWKRDEEIPCEKCNPNQV